MVVRHHVTLYECGKRIFYVASIDSTMRSLAGRPDVSTTPEHVVRVYARYKSKKVKYLSLGQAPMTLFIEDSIYIYSFLSWTRRADSDQAYYGA